MILLFGNLKTLLLRGNIKLWRSVHLCKQQFANQGYCLLQNLRANQMSLRVKPLILSRSSRSPSIILFVDIYQKTWYFLNTRQIYIYLNLITRFLISNTSMSNARLKLAKNQANAQQNPETGFLQFENYSCFSSTLLSKNNGTYSKNKQNNKCVCIHEIIWLIIMKMKMKMKKDHIYRIFMSLSIYIYIYIYKYT